LRGTSRVSWSVVATSATEVSVPGRGLYPIVCDDDVVQFRHRVREAAVAAGLRLIDQTKPWSMEVVVWVRSAPPRPRDATGSD
jgi:hypothetical protein